MLTPAVTIVSAMEGLQVATSGVSRGETFRRALPPTAESSVHRETFPRAQAESYMSSWRLSTLFELTSNNFVVNSPGNLSPLTTNFFWKTHRPDCGAELRDHCQPVYVSGLWPRQAGLRLFAHPLRGVTLLRSRSPSRCIHAAVAFTPHN